MKESADMVGLTQPGEKFLPIMAKRRVPDIVPEGYGLDQVFIQTKKTPYCPRDFRYELYVQDPVGDMVVFDKIKYLGLVYITGISQRMENPVSIYGKSLPMPRILPGIRTPPKALAAPACPPGEDASLPVVQFTASGQKHVRTAFQLRPAEFANLFTFPLQKTNVEDIYFGL
jgi:hypothetical protein